MARDHLAGITALGARLKTAAQISALVTATGTTLAGLFGVGPVTAARILAETGDVSRFAARDKFISWCRTRSLSLFSVRRADIETFARELEALGRPARTVPGGCAPSPGSAGTQPEEGRVGHSPAAHVRHPGWSSGRVATS